MSPELAEFEGHCTGRSPHAVPWRTGCFLFGSLVLLLCFGGSVRGADQTGPSFRSDRILVKPKHGTKIAGLHAAANAKTLHTFERMDGLQIVQLPEGAKPRDVIAQYQASGQVEYAELDYVVHIVDSPNDPYFVDGSLWGLYNYGQNGGTAGADIHAKQAWDIRNSSPNVIVAVLDTGIRYTHEDLAPNIWTDPLTGFHGIDVVPGNTHPNDPMDDHGHGTHVAGTIGAAGNNGKGVVGVTRQVQIMACKFLNNLGYGNTSDAITCIDYAAAHGASIMSNSWGGTDSSQALQDAIKAVGKAGILFVVAAGNNASNNDTTPFYPACYTCSNLIAVASTNRTDGLSSFSNYGPTRVHLGAPGESIISCWCGSDTSYNALNGTSMATPHVSGALALMTAQYPSFTYQQLKSGLLLAADPIPALNGKCVSNGRLNLYKALSLPPASAVFTVAGFPSPVAAGTARAFTVTVQDLNGQTNPGYRGTVHFTSSDDTAVLPADYTFLSSDAGAHTFTATLEEAGAQSITATETVNVANIGSQAGITVRPATAAALGIGGLPSTIGSGKAVSVTVIAQDAYGNTATGYQGTVHFTSTDATAVLPDDYTFVSGDNGTHTFIDGVTFNALGMQSITAAGTAVQSGTVHSVVVSHMLTIATLAGLAGRPGQADGTGSAAGFSSPSGMAVDNSGNAYVADINCAIRKITPGGVVSTVAGKTGNQGSADGTGSAARFNSPEGLAVDGSGNIYVADTYNHTIREITPGGVVSTLAGLAGSSGKADGTGTTARFFIPGAVAVDGSGDVYVADTGNNTIRKITPGGVVSTLAGLAGSRGSADGTGSAARFYTPYGVAVDGSGNVFVADTGNHTIRRITPGAVVSTVAGLAGNSGSTDDIGSAARFSSPHGVAVDSSGNVYAADTDNCTIRKIMPGGVVSTPAGLAEVWGSADGTGSTARFCLPGGVAVDNSGCVYVADTGNDTIRCSVEAAPVITSAVTASECTSEPFSYSITAEHFPTSYNATPLPDGLSLNASTGAITGTPTTPGATSVTLSATNVVGTGSATLLITIAGPLTISTLAGLGGISGSTDGTGSAARFGGPRGVAVDNSGNVYAADTDNCTIRKITPGGAVSTLAGLAGSSGSADGTGSAARFSNPDGLGVDGSGNIYVADGLNHVIRKITPAGVVSTLAGLAGNGGSADGTGSAARFYYPAAVAVDGSGTVYVADTSNSTIRKVTSAGVVSTLAGLAGSVGFADGTGSAARFNYPVGVAVDSSDNVYVADTGNHVIRKITSAGVVTTLAGPLVWSSGSADGMGSAARFLAPCGVSVDGLGHVYVADTSNHSIRMITPGGVVSTLAGLAGTSGTADGAGSAARFHYPNSVAVDSSGIVYVADDANNTIRRGMPAPPIIASATAATGTLGLLFSYQIAAVNNPISYSATPLPAGLSVNTGSGLITGTPLAPGTTNITISATNAGGTGSATLILTINKRSQTITFNALPTIVNDAPDFALGARASSGLPVAYSSSNTAVATMVNGMVHLVSAGNTTITASQSGDGNYDPAPDIQQTLTVIPGTPLEVFVRFTIPASVFIAWGTGTTGRTAGDVSTLDWTVQDATGGQVGRGETCVSNDAYNNVAMNLENTTNTGSKARVSATVAGTGGWNIASAPTTDTFAIKAQFGTNQQVVLATYAQELTRLATLAKGADQALVLTVMTPTGLSRDAGVEKTMFVVLTATPE